MRIDVGNGDNDYNDNDYGFYRQQDDSQIQRLKRERVRMLTVVVNNGNDGNDGNNDNDGINET